MAKAQGLVNIEGTVENYTFYKKDGKNFVRTKGGVSRERIMTDPNYIRTRENNREFAESGLSGKLLRDSLGSLVFRAKDSLLSSRLLKVMSEIKNLDTSSTRGNRTVARGLASAEGKQFLTGFNFNRYAPLNSVLFVPYVLNTTTGAFDIASIITEQNMRYPEGATHVSFQTAALGIDFDTQVTNLVLSTATVNVPIGMTDESVDLAITTMPTSTGVVVYVLLITFYQEVNNIQYALKNEEYNSLSILDVV